ncbi:hypothetical protein F485_gp205 [Aeromonas phage CC2]|uniref:Uncharacterized protein n=1 Tax=Aeromonas phage CC2 TaxID=1204516 RepID=I6XLS5_9CAUD|nr:hypothetical protein F485_gp205 [Aeromonas phage CC2]AFN39469.1 hypothetical protein CC2_090 [Aeromonas phage CC2]
MSSMEFVKGKVITTGLEVEPFMEANYPDWRNESCDPHDAFYELVTETEFMILHKKVYRVLEYKELDSCGYTDIEQNEDGTVSFVSLWYNGGACLSETIEGAMK